MLVRRLIQREAIPMLAQVALWALVGASLGARALAAVLTANLCVSAARGACTAITARPIRLRRPAAGAALRIAVRRGWAIEFASLIASLALLAAIAVFYGALGVDRLWPLLAILAWGLPPRCNGPLRAPVATHWPRLLRSAAGVAAVLAVVATGATLDKVLWALVAREWLTALALALVPPRAPGAKTLAAARADPPAWREFLEATAVGATRRFVYHAGRSTLHALLGPFGTVVARTSRGLGLHRAPGERPLVRRALPFAAPAAIAAAILVAKLLPGPGALLISALLLRLGLLAAGAALWNRLFPRDILATGEGAGDED